jgi:hypothetical protein
MAAADEYRRLAAECLLIAEDVIHPESRNLLIHMSQSWLRLAHQAEKNLATNIGYETLAPPCEASGLAVVQQQQRQIKSKIEE